MSGAKNRKKQFGITGIFLFLILTMALFSMPSATVMGAEKTQETQSQTQQRKVRVAFPEQEGMSVVGENGSLTGYNYEYLGKIAEFTGWDMEYVTYNSEDGNEAVLNAMNEVREGKIDLLGPILKMEAGLASFYRRGDGNKDVLAVVEGLENAIDTSEWRTVITFSNTEKCVKAVAEGVADARVGDHNSVEYYTYDTSNNLIVSTISGHTSSICLAANKKRDMEFLGILNVYLYSLSDTEKTAYLSDGNIHLRKISLKYFASQYPGETTAADFRTGHRTGCGSCQLQI